MDSTTHDPSPDHSTPNRVSMVSDSFQYDRLRPASGSSNPDAISPVESRETTEQRPDNALLNEKSFKESSTNTTGAGGRPARTVKAAALPALCYRKRSLCLLGCYVPFLVVPWVLTCVLAIRPLSLSSYYNQMGQYGMNDFAWMWFWMGFVKVINSIASLITVPTVSALLAQGAVVYTQRRRLKQVLSLRQTFALSDRGWADIPILWGARRGAGTSSKYLWLAAGLLLLSAIQVPIQQALVTTEIITVMTCDDDPIYSLSKYCDPSRVPIIVGYDPEPADLAQVPQNAVVLETAKNVASASDLDVQLRMWHDPVASTGKIQYDNMAESNTFFWYYWCLDPPCDNPTYFVSALPNATTTGILREHVMRLNSTVQCSNIKSNDFPSDCEGTRPFTTSFSRPSDLTIDICVPGDYRTTPWNLSRNRQDLDEEIYIKVHVPLISSLGFSYDGSLENITVHCKSTTTRGYFELGNLHNNNTAGPLMSTWPDNYTMLHEYNDYLNFAGNYGTPSVVIDWVNKHLSKYINVPRSAANGPCSDNTSTSFPIWYEPPDPFGTYSLDTPGPLMTSALALFGNQSFFYVAANSSSSTYPSAIAQICQAGNIPFQRLALLSEFTDAGSFCVGINERWYETHGDDEDTLTTFLYNWFLGFNDTPLAVEALSTAVFFSTQAWLTQTADATWSVGGARQIFTSTGFPVFRPAKTLAGTIIVSSLIFLQLVGLSVLAWYIYTVPTWTTALDSLAVARLAKSVSDDELPPIGPVDEDDLKKLRKVDGLVGVVDEEDAAAGSLVAIASGGLAAEEHEPKNSLVGMTFALHDPADSTVSSTSFKLARGAPGLITKRHTPPQKKKYKRKGKATDGNTLEKQGLRLEEP